MKQVILIMCTILIFFTIGCNKVEEEKERLRNTQIFVNDIISEIKYIKDKRTDLYFAYLWDGSGSGGPALAAIPRDSISPRLLAMVCEMSKKITYIKDKRTDLCFAYLWDGSGSGGPVLATVPCESIPPELLTTSNGITKIK